LVLGNERPARAHPAEKPLVAGHQRRVGLEGTYSENDHVINREIAGADGAVVEHIDADAHRRDGLRHRVPGAGDVSDAQVFVHHQIEGLHFDGGGVE
jgi:hypothetical protein